MSKLEDEFWKHVAAMLKTLPPKARVLAIASCMEKSTKSNLTQSTDEELAAAALTLARSLMVNLSTAQTAVVQSLVVSREALKGGVHAALEIEIGKVFDP